MDYKEIKSKLDKVSSTFCIAKWKQVTIHLEHGYTHSCHHPRVHKIPLDEIKNNPSALHNTKFKKKIRQDMLDGKYINECEYCNKIFQKTPSIINDRVYKSSEKWALPYLSECIKNLDAFPSYLEVSFSSKCNCKCIYCSANFSTQWQKEINEYGPYNIKSFDKNNIPKKIYSNDNPYIEAFYKWWSELYENLHTFRITGGEPLLHNSTFKLIDYMIKNPREELQFSINTNFSVHKKIIKKFVQKIKILITNMPSFTLYTSCEAKGERANYIRNGMNYDDWLKNCEYFLSQTNNTRLSIMAAYNFLSITSYTDFLKDILELKLKYPNRILIDTPYLNNPVYLNPNIMPNNFIKYIKESLEFMKNNSFEEYEIQKINVIYNILENNTPKLTNRKQFKDFIIEHDKRNNTDFLKVFPEYKYFYKGIN